jgi:hypothetical protein
LGDHVLADGADVVVVNLELVLLPDGVDAVVRGLWGNALVKQSAYRYLIAHTMLAVITLLLN